MFDKVGNFRMKMEMEMNLRSVQYCYFICILIIGMCFEVTTRVELVCNPCNSSHVCKFQHCCGLGCSALWRMPKEHYQRFRDTLSRSGPHRKMKIWQICHEIMTTGHDKAIIEQQSTANEKHRAPCHAVSDHIITNSKVYFLLRRFLNA